MRSGSCAPGDGSRAAGRDHGAIDAAALERIAETLALRLVGEGPDFKTVEGAEISDLDLVDLRPSRSELLALARGLLPEDLASASERLLASWRR